MKRWMLLVAGVLTVGCSPASSEASGFRADVVVVTLTDSTGKSQRWVVAPVSDEAWSVGLRDGEVYTVTVDVRGSETAGSDRLQWFSRWLQQGPLDVRTSSSTVVGDGTGEGAIVLAEFEVSVAVCDVGAGAELKTTLAFELFSDGSVAAEPAATATLAVTVVCDQTVGLN